MEKITTGVSYTTSAVGTGYWLLQLLDKVSPSQWVAIGVLGSLLFGLLTYPLHYSQCVERPYYSCAVLSPYSCINRDRSPTGRILCASVRG